MYLFFLSNAQVEAPSLLHPDSYMRPLTQEGLDNTRRAAKRIHELLGGFDLVVTGSLPRSRITGEIVAAACGYDREPQVNNMLDGRTQAEGIVRRLIDQLERETVLLIGDAPVLERLIAFLITQDEKTQVRVYEGAIACVELKDALARQGILHWLVPGATLWTPSQ
ncbi:MAG TPA: hypothetical protein VM492_02270 [Sumerlaeia bacterium]|nr:hypothetical protein [Sumerlaeia bacterium]